MAELDTTESSQNLFCRNCGVAVMSDVTECSQCGAYLDSEAKEFDIVGDYVPYCRACGVPVAKDEALHCTRCGVSPLCQEHFYPSTRSCSLCPLSETDENESEQPSLSRLPTGPWAKPVAAVPCPQYCARIRPGVEFCPDCGAGQRNSKDSEFAGLFVRVGASLVDTLVPLALTGLLFPWIDIPGVFLLFFVAYHSICTYRIGQSPGKMLLGLQVVNLNGEKPSLKQILMREVLGKLIVVFTLFIGFLWIIGDPKRRGWHDYLGGTYVTHKKRL